MRIARPLIVAAAVAAGACSLLPGTKHRRADAGGPHHDRRRDQDADRLADAPAIRGGVIMAVGGAATINALRGDAGVDAQRQRGAAPV